MCGEGGNVGTFRQSDRGVWFNSQPGPGVPWFYLIITFHGCLPVPGLCAALPALPALVLAKKGDQYAGGKGFVCAGIHYHTTLWQRGCVPIVHTRTCLLFALVRGAGLELDSPLPPSFPSLFFVDNSLFPISLKFTKRNVKWFWGISSLFIETYGGMIFTVHIELCDPPLPTPGKAAGKVDSLIIE